MDIKQTEEKVVSESKTFLKANGITALIIGLVIGGLLGHFL